MAWLRTGMSLLVMMIAVLACIGGETARAGESILNKQDGLRYRYRIELTVSEVWEENLGVLLYMPYPVSSEFQEIEIIGHTPGEVVPIPGSGDDKCLRIFFPPEELGPGDSTKVFIEFIATLYDFSTDFEKMSRLYPYDKDSELYQLYTAGSKPPFIDPELPALAKVADKLNAESENDLEYAWRAFRYVKGELAHSGGAMRRQPLKVTLRKGGDPGSLNAAFVSLLRRRGIPARVAVACRTSRMINCWTEFYFEEYGWIAADPSVEVTRDDFWGRVALHPNESKTKRQALGVVMNHVYEGCVFPGVEEGQEVEKEWLFLDCAFWGLYSAPKYTVSVTEMDDPAKAKRGSGTPMKKLRALPLR